jgi:hypothetical protein
MQTMQIFRKLPFPTYEELARRHSGYQLTELEYQFVYLHFLVSLIEHEDEVAFFRERKVIPATISEQDYFDYMVLLAISKVTRMRRK